MNNSLYLKRYVETHPDNKMAWYLLGKEYEQAGEQGKANYCYNKAEGVYEAFELSQVPSDIWKNYEQRLLEMERDKDRRRKRTRRLLAALVLLLLVFLPPAQAPGSVPGILHQMCFRRMSRYPPRPLTKRSGIRVKNRCIPPLLPVRGRIPPEPCPHCFGIRRHCRIGRSRWG